MASVHYLLQRHGGLPYENAAFKAARAEWEAEKAKVLEQKQRQLEEIVKAESEKITQHYKAQNEAVQRLLDQKEQELRDANEETRLAAQTQIENLTRMMQENIDAAEQEREQRIQAVREEAQRLTNDEMRKLQTAMSEEISANQKVIAQLRNEIAEMNSSKCIIL